MTPQTGKLDEQGTTVTQATEMLQKLLHGFDNNKETLAVVLGRSKDEIEHALSGNSEAFDDDLVMKMRGIAQQRNIEI
jgi:hypothetical protein